MQPGASVRYLPQEPDLSGLRHDARLCRGRARRRPTMRTGRAISCSSSASRAKRTPRGFRAARRAAPRSPTCWRLQPDILLLDEPTNHLDLPAIEWLEATLAAAARRAGPHQPRPPLPREPVAHDRLARPRQDPPHRARLSRVRGLARREARRGGDRSSTSSTARSSPRSTGCATASPRGASATCGAWRSCAHCARRGASIAAPPAARRSTAARGGEIRHARHRGEGASSKSFGDAHDRRAISPTA